MRTRSAMLALGLALAAAPLPAHAGWTGRLGLMYTRADAWSGTNEHLLVPQLTLDGDLTANGSLFGPEWLTWSGAAGYHRLTSTVGNLSSRANALSYNGAVSVLDYLGSPLRLGAFASRSNGDSKTSVGDVSSLVSVVTQSYGASAGVDAPQRPSLFLNGVVTESRLTAPDGTTSESEVRRLSANTRHGTSAYSYNLSYAGTWSDGTYANDNSKSHEFGLSGSVKIAPDVTNHLEQHMYLRLPTTSATTNATVEMSSVASGVRVRFGEMSSDTSYSYSRSFFSAPGSDERTSVGQAVSESLQYAGLGRWGYGGGLSASFAQQRLGATEQSTASQSVSGNVGWSNDPGLAPPKERRDTRAIERTEGRPDDRVDAARVFTYGGSLSGSAGVLEGAGPLAPVFGTNAHGAAGWRLAATSLTGSYDLGFGLNTGAAEGWSFSQSAGVSASRSITEQLTASTSLSASASRAHSALFGDTASRTLALNANAAWLRYRLQADAGLSSGFSAGGQVVHGDGLFIPAAFDSYTLFAGATLTVPLTRKLSSRAAVRYRASSAPDRADEHQASIQGGMDYSLGAFVFSADERYETVTFGTVSSRRNDFMFRVARSFGSW